MTSAYPGPHGRQHAIELKAADAKTLLQSTLPYLLQIMTAEQVGQVQKILDAAVVNPDLQRDYADARRKAVASEHARGIYSDGAMSRTADSPQMVRIARELIDVSNADKHIRLDHTKILGHGALHAQSDNPDEATYLNTLMQMLGVKGVYLRIEPMLVHDPEDRSRWIVGNRDFNVWLSLGFDGDPIPTKDGKLTREALLDTTSLGAGYYTKVIKGRAQSLFDQTADRVRRTLSNGMDLHSTQRSARTTAAPGVVGVSDYLGNADFPSQKMWDLPWSLLTKARTANKGGNIVVGGKLLTYAAVFADISTRRLNTYIDATVRGAQRAVGALTVIKEVSEIIETALMAWSIAGAALELAASEAATKGATKLGRKAIDRAVFDKMLEGGGRVGAEKLEANAPNWIADVSKVFDAAAKRGVELSEEELDSLCRAADAKWGTPSAWAAPSGTPGTTLRSFSNEVSNGVRKYYSH